MKRKIQDNVLLEMLKDGKQQKEIALQFNVSPAAICKRIKRLLPQPEAVLDKFSLSEKEKRFAIEKAKGKTNTQAALESFEVSSMQSAKVIGSQLMDKPEVRMAIDELLETHGLTRTYRVKKLKQHVDHADPGVSLKALDMSFKLADDYPTNRSQGNTTLSFIEIKHDLFKPPADIPAAIDVKPADRQ